MAKNPTITFPKGVAVFPALYRPDTKFDELGVYKADFKLPAEEAAPVIEKIQAFAKQHLGKALSKSGNPVFEPEVDRETGDETGDIIFKCRVKNKLRRSDGKLWDRRPLLIDAKKNDMPSDCNPWGGSVIRVQAEVNMGDKPKKFINLQPLMVQVIDLVTGGSRGDASAFDEEDGYDASEDGETKADTSDFDTGETSTDDDEY